MILSAALSILIGTLASARAIDGRAPVAASNGKTYYNSWVCT